MLTPRIALFMIIFLALGFLSIRINGIKVNLTKNQKEKYIKKFPIIKISTSIAIIVFILSIVTGCFIQFNNKVLIENTSPILFFITLGCCFLLISTIIHYGILLKITKKL